MAQAGKKKILIVDDEPNIRLLISMILGSEYNVIQAADGIEADKKVISEKPDLVLLDILMPNEDGYTCLDRIRKNPNTRAIPVIMLTALDQKLNVELAKSFGASDYITKPFETDELRRKVNEYLK